MTLLTPTQEALVSFERNTAEEVYTQIVKDLEASMALVEDGAYNGRVNKRAVIDMLAKVHLTRSYEAFAASDDATKAAAYASAAERWVSF